VNRFKHEENDTQAKYFWPGGKAHLWQNIFAGSEKRDHS
jgi:hypothetical protein